MNYFYYTIIFCFIYNASWSQCYPDRHNTTWHDGWISCEVSVNPNSSREPSHWILYNFSQPYALQKMQLWNTNDPFHLDRGMKNIVVDYSIDGTSWTELGPFELAQAEGRSDYQGETGLDFEGKKVQYVLITALDNYGGDCFGLSEVRFETTDEVKSEMTTSNENENFCVAIKVYPNPFRENPTLGIHSNCPSQVSYTITDAVGRTIMRQDLDRFNHFNETLALEDLVPGMYFLNVRHGNQSTKEKLIKMQ